MSGGEFVTVGQDREGRDVSVLRGSLNLSVSGDQLDLDAIEARWHAPTLPRWVDERPTALALVAEVRRLREERAAIDLMDWPGEAHRLQAALHFARGTINDMAATIERLENEARE